MLKKIQFLLLCVVLSAAMVAQDFDDNFVENTFIAEGKGSTKKGAIVRARVEAMLKFLKLNMDSGDYESHNQQIETFLVENYREYTHDNVNVVQPYRDRQIRIMVEVKGDVLLQDIKNKFLRARSKAAGIWVSVNADRKVNSNRSLDMVLATVQDELGKHFTVRDTVAMKNLMKKEGQMLDLSASSDPQNYTWRKFSSIPIAMYFWLKMGYKYDEGTGGKVYRARIGARAVHVVTAQELFHFQHDKIGSTREGTIMTASIEVAQKIVAQVSQYNTILPEGEYTYKFVNFERKEDRDKIRQTMLDLKNGKRRYLDILPGGIGGGESYFTYRVKWLRSHSQFEMIQIVLEYLATNQVVVKCDKFTQKVMIFEPPNSNWSGGGNTGGGNNDYQPPVEEPVYEDDCDYIIAEGKARTKKSAITRAWREAMLKFLEDNVEYEYFEGNRNKIERFLVENWEDYTSTEPEEAIILRRFDGRRIRIKVCIEQDDLLKDIYNLVKKADDKLSGMWVAIVSDRENNPYQGTKPSTKDENTDRDVMFDYLQNLLGKHMKIRDLRALDRLMKKEAQMLGLSAGADPQAFIARKFAQVQIVVYLWLTTRRVSRDPATGTPVWYATVGCRLVHLQTAQELVKFQITSGDKTSIKPVGVFGGLTERMARAEAIKNVVRACYERVYNQIRTRKTVLQENIYTVKFANFTSRQERRIKDAILDLKSGKRAYCKIEASTGGGSGYMEYTLKWRRTRDTQADIIDIIIGYCEDNEVQVDSNKSTKGVIYFEPAEDEDDDDF
ncbi:hypothetical protein [Candidatus Uabimicrobium amorphum]|uniref:Uncharacterized protein n=1 Tax=Uabimicrobium amorphum TaxID=2596890 RepID=A0A5S9F6C2_UABAM|nr:hypothetical protein [Candidatus Uabimicrobium amorphum]BBM86464.1 hypothetical protein UABAM_04850 [Candidatus Uabimicrobium amorphum]